MPDTMSRDVARVEAAAARAEAATPGKWTAEDQTEIWDDADEDGLDYCWQTEIPENERVQGWGTCDDADECEGHDNGKRSALGKIEGPKYLYPMGDEEGYYFSLNDATFMAASRSDVPWLCSELLAAWAENERLEHGCREVVRGVLTAGGAIPLRPYEAMARTVVGYIGHLLDDAKMKALAEEPAP